MINSLVKGTFNDTIVKQYILAAVKANRIPPTPAEAGAKRGTYSDSTGKTALSTSTDAHPEKSVCPENTCICPLVFQLFLCIAL